MLTHIRGAIMAILLLAVCAGLPLSAQLDTRLQSSNTDFLDLYQQSTQTKVKPEILTIFDFSGSMQALMFHPLYVNADSSDSGSSGSMSFTLSNSGTTYTISVTASITSTGGGPGGTTTTTESATVTTTVGGAFTTASGGNSRLSISAVPSTCPAAGNAVVLTASLRSSGGNTTLGSGGYTWSISSGSYTASGTSNNTCTWTVPNSTSGAYVTATVSGSSVGPLTSNTLIKPDGTLVTSTDAAAASSSSGLYGASAGASDIRNWVRAASHVRFSYAVSSSVTRTVDIPIPWKIMDSSSSGNPLSSQTILDKEVVTHSDGTSTTYGTLGSIEMDSTYKLSSGSYVLSGSSSTATSTTLSRVDYKKAYVDWLFLGTYSVGTYAGKYIVFDAATLGLAGGQSTLAEGQGFGSDAASYSIKVPDYNLNGTYAGTETTKSATSNVVPALSRVQAVKRAAIKTWISHQADVLWAFRFLDDSSAEAGSGSATSINNSSTASSSYHGTQYGEDSGWRLLNGSSATNMAYIASRLESTCTPLTYAMARGLAQFADPNSIFEGVETGTDAPSQCMNHFLILFTDGVDNNACYGSSKSATPYLSTTSSVTSFNAKAGNTAILASKSSIDRSGAYWDLFTFAAVAAHMSNSSLGTAGTHYMAVPGSLYSSTSTTSGSPSAFLPFAIKKRGDVTYSKDHRITTMTVGVSLGGQYTDSASPKRSLFLAAAMGDPVTTSCTDLSTLVPFKWDATLNSGNGGKVSNSIYFFDGNTPDTLSTSLGYAIQSAIAASNINTSSNPNLPYVGASLGGQIYVGKFRPPTNGGSIWGGDLLMFNTILSSNTLKFLDTSGALTTTLDTTTAQWSAQQALYSNRLWSARKLYTRIPRTDASTAEDSLKLSFSDTGTPFTTLKSYVAQGANAASYPAGGTSQKTVIRFVMGGDLDGSLDSDGRPTANRANIMGDIINSSPAAIEYKFADVSASLTGALAAVGGDRFRLILVGTNQGWIHAFGEVTKATTLTLTDGTTRTIRTGAVDELWSFMPTDFLSNLDQVTVSTNAHRFMVDGTPLIYHLDLPPTGGGAADGVVEISSSPGPERCLAIFGLGKGGRSYYALNLADPFTPVLKWSLRPDESAYLTSDRILTRSGSPDLATVKSVVANMGFSTCTPAVGRVQVTATPGDTSTSVVRDVLFLGGGHSVPEVEANFTDSSSNPILLGRSVLALDVYTGKIIAAVDMSSLAGATDTSGRVTMGPVSKGVVPFEFVLNSGMAQRAYFLDFWGGLWSWGRQMTDTDSSSSTYQYRMDSSDMSTWTSDGVATSSAGIRLVAKDRSGNAVSLASGAKTTLHYSEALYSTLPAPFRVSSFPGKATLTSSPVPAAVGIALESGDRNNPLDYYYTSTTLPSNHRLSVVFDRQDSLRWGFTSSNPIVISDTTSHLLDAYPSFSSYAYGDALISQGNSSYYLAPSTSSATKFGYFRKFPTRDTTTKLVPKGINSPMVVSGSLYYSYFTPTEADVCTGGSGYTYSNLICDVMNPVVVDARTTVSCQSGSKYTWIGVASDYTALGNRGVIQTGTVSSTSTTDTSTTALAATTLTGKASAQYPKPRVWRTVH